MTDGNNTEAVARSEIMTLSEIARHLKEYFCRPDQDFPAALQWGLRWLSPDSMADKMSAK